MQPAIHSNLCPKRWLPAAGYGCFKAARPVLLPCQNAGRRAGSLLLPYCRGGAPQGAIRAANLRAAIEIPPTGGSPRSAWGVRGFRRSFAVGLMLQRAGLKLAAAAGVLSPMAFSCASSQISSLRRAEGNGCLQTAARDR